MDVSWFVSDNCIFLVIFLTSNILRTAALVMYMFSYHSFSVIKRPCAATQRILNEEN